MTIKRILFAVLCTLLVLVVVMTGIVVQTVVSLFQKPAGGGNGTLAVPESTAGTHNTTESTGDPEPSTEATEPTEPIHQHEYTNLIKITHASCSSMGYKEYACSCGKMHISDYEDALGHAYGEAEDVAPTCTEKGFTVRKCSRCGDKDIWDEVPALEHEFDQGTEVPATCVEGTHTLYKCIREGCTEEKKENVQNDIQEHSFGRWIPVDSEQYMSTCTKCAEVTVTTEPTGDIASLKITDAKTSDEKDGETIYRLYRITVGADEAAALFTYTIQDYLNNGTLAYEYDAALGLIVTYQEGETPIRFVMANYQNDQCVVKASES